MDNEKKDKTDELIEGMMIGGALLFWMLFETFNFLNGEYAERSVTGYTRQALLMIVSNLFTWKFSRDKGKK